MIKDQVLELENLFHVKENAEKMYELSDKLFKDSSMAMDKEGMMISDYHRAYYYFFFKNNVSKASSYATSALDLAKDLKNNLYIIKAAELVGYLYLYKFEINSALEFLLLSFNVANKSQSKRGIVTSTLHIGDVFYVLKDYKAAYDYYSETRDMALRNDFPRDLLMQEILFKHIICSVMLNKIEVLDSSIKIAMMNFDDKMRKPFIALKSIISLLNRLKYIERSIVEDIYAIFIQVDDIFDPSKRCMVALLLSKLVEQTDDTDLIIDYVELLDTYKHELKYLFLKEEIESVKASLLGFDTDSEQTLSYAYLLADQNHLMLNAIDSLVKKVLSIHTAELERDKEMLKNEELKQLSSTDELTGLYNRRTGVEMIEKITADPSKQAYSFIMIDFDNFKQINDNYGHGIGDKTLVFISKTLKQIFESDSVIVRLGGDEFVVLLYNLPTDYIIRKSVTVYKINILLTFLASSPIEFLDGNKVSVSCGVCISEGTFDELYKKSDIALYSSKAAGKGQITVFEDENIEIKEEDKDTSVKAVSNKDLNDVIKAEEERKAMAAKNIVEERIEAAKAKENEKAKEELDLDDLNASETEVIGEVESRDDNNESELDDLLENFKADVVIKEEDKNLNVEEKVVFKLDPREILRRRREAVSIDLDDDDEDDDEDDEDTSKVNPKILLQQRREALRAKAKALSKVDTIDSDDVDGEDDEEDD